MDGSGDDRISFLGRPLPPGFTITAVVVAPGRAQPFDAVDWSDALVVVEVGRIDLEGVSGATRRFGCGAVLALDGVPLQALRNPGPGAAVLVAIRGCG